MSFAGQQETYLNVRAEDGLLDAVKRCWASLWTARAIGYRLKMGIDQRSVAIAVAKGSERVLNRFLSIAAPRSGLHSALFLRGFPSKALDAEAELQAIAEQLRGSDGLRELVRSTPARRLLDALKASPAGKPVLERLQRYLDRYGHQVYNLDFAEPTQAEDPTPVLLSLKAQLQRSGMEVRARQAEMARERESLVEKTARSLDPLRRRLFLKILRWAQGLAPYREEAFFYVGSAWPALRRLALELGRRLVEAGSLHPGLPDHHASLDASLRAGPGAGHGHRRGHRPRFYRGAGVWDPGGYGHGQRDPADSQRADGNCRRRLRDSDPVPLSACWRQIGDPL